MVPVNETSIRKKQWREGVEDVSDRVVYSAKHGLYRLLGSGLSIGER
jgi:hypothetical protein